MRTLISKIFSRSQGPDFFDLRFLEGRSSFPDLCVPPDKTVLISSGGGRCLRLDIQARTVEYQPVVGYDNPILAHALRHPIATATEPVLCCAASHQTKTTVWEVESKKTYTVNPEGAVNTVAFSPFGHYLAVGNGMYPLDPNNSTAMAVVELFLLRDLSRPIAQCVMPGVAVDCMAFHPFEDILAVVVGERAQDRGSIATLDSQTLELIDIAEVPRVMHNGIWIDAERERLITLYRRGVEVRPLENLKEVEWEFRTSEDVWGADYEQFSEWMYLSNGQVIALGKGEVLRLPVPDECTDMAILDSNTVIGATSLGILRSWNIYLSVLKRAEERVAKHRAEKIAAKKKKLAEVGTRLYRKLSPGQHTGK